MNTAMLVLACRDYEALELALACHAAYLPEGVPFFILQNCRGNYDAERTLVVARRYEQLYPRTIKVIDAYPPDSPYRSIARLLASEHFAEIELVCKVDDDAFPLRAGWLNTLVETYRKEDICSARSLAYVTPLINNNTWGFAQVLDVMMLQEAYTQEAAMEHRVGVGDTRDPYRILPKQQIYTGANGTIWGYPHIARWLHYRTTLDPDQYLAATESLSVCDVPSGDRYSIGCIVFRKSLWPTIDDGGQDDEHMMHQYCRTTAARIVCARSVPFVHLAYFSQREENRDLIEVARAVYEPRLGLPFPIRMQQSRLLEIEARLRFLEGQGLCSAPPLPPPMSAPKHASEPEIKRPKSKIRKTAKAFRRAALRALRLRR